MSAASLMLCADGFDARVHPRDLVEWGEERRRQYLVRRDVAVPLSIDPNVWPRFGPSDQAALPARVPWMELAEVVSAASAWRRDARDSCVLLAVGALAADDAERASLARDAGMERALRVEDDWTFLGYDVADGDISGLCNCGYRAEDALLVAREVWAPRLDEHGLFVEPEDALEFRRLTNLRVPEHAPFLVKALWTVPWPDPEPVTTPRRTPRPSIPQ